MLEIIRIAALRVGGVPALARSIGVTRQAVYQWREVPAERVPDIAALTGLQRAELRPDLFGDSELSVAAGDHETADGSTEPQTARPDRVAWIEAQAIALAEGRMDGIERRALAELLADIADEARRDVENRLGVVLHRLLKWQLRMDRRSMSSLGVIAVERARLLDRFHRSPSLRDHALATLPRVHETARKHAAAECGLEESAVPVKCPFSFEEILDPGFLPMGHPRS